MYSANRDMQTQANCLFTHWFSSVFARTLKLVTAVAEPPLGRARAAALGASRRDLEHTVNNKGSGEQEVGWI